MLLFVPTGWCWSSEAPREEQRKREKSLQPPSRWKRGEFGEASLISSSPEPREVGVQRLLCYMLALIKGKYAAPCRTLLFI